MKPRLTLLAAFFGFALVAPSAAAADYVDPPDGFHATVDPSGFIACTTYPADRWDSVDCDGLNADFEATLRAQISGDVTVLGGAVFRAEDWGFRVLAWRYPGPPPLLSEAEDAAFVESLRAGTETLFAKVIGPAGVDARMETRRDLRLVRLSYETRSEPPTAMIDLVVPAAHAMYQLRFIGARDHAKELAAIVERTADSLRAVPAPRRPRAWGVIAMVVIAALSLAGTAALLVLLREGRRKKRASAVSWPGLRG